MLSEVIELQSNAVSSIIDKINSLDVITFKSPTGSGKTYMMADLMNRILNENEDIIFLVSSLSKSSLATQNYEKFIEYVNNHNFDKLNPYLITSETSGENRLFIPTDYNVYILPRDLNKKANSRLNQGALQSFLYTITASKNNNGLNKKIYVIKDECHQKTTNLDSLSKAFFSKTINFSATPLREQIPNVEISEYDAINTKLIKKVEYLNENDSLDTAINKFEEIKQKYLRSIGINPCLIIQISNSEKAEEELKEIYKTLGNKPHLKWMLITSGDSNNDTNDQIKKSPVNEWRTYAKKNTSTIDVIIFKQVITEGWDIPRACMLYQIRNSKSEILGEQVLGRIRRNPCLLYYETLSNDAKDLISTAYVWGLKKKSESTVTQVKLAGQDKDNEIKEELKVRTTVLKNFNTIKTFNISDFIGNQKEKLQTDSIFDLYRKYTKSPNEVRQLGSTYIDSIEKWFNFTQNIDAISKEVKNIVCNYSSNMELLKDDNGIPIEVSLPLLTYYTDNGNYRNITNWLWQRTDNSEEFSFDSDAEKEWCDILINLISEDAPTGNGRIIKSITIQENNEDTKKYLIGKNYLPNSMIKYEYYLNGIRSSYPDFIMKDYQDRIHLFETKCLNIANNSTIDKDEYENKITALKTAYKFASQLTGYFFYIPIKRNNDWLIFQYAGGNERTLSKKDFIDFLKRK